MLVAWTRSGVRLLRKRIRTPGALPVHDHVQRNAIPDASYRLDRLIGLGLPSLQASLRERNSHENADGYYEA